MNGRTRAISYRVICLLRSLLLLGRSVDDTDHLIELIDLLKLTNPPNSSSTTAAASIASSSSDPSLTGAATSSVRGKRPKNIEESRLDTFLLKHSKRYEFSGDLYSRLLTALLEQRLFNNEWERAASREHRLRVLRAIRVLSRDSSLQEHFLKYKPLPQLANMLHRYTNDYFSGEPPYAAESVVEVCSILKRISSEESQDRKIFEQPLFLRSLVGLLSARDHAVLQAVLVTLVNLSASSMFVEKIMELAVIEPLLNVLNEFSSAWILNGNAAAAISNGGSSSNTVTPLPTPTPTPQPSHSTGGNSATAAAFAHSHSQPIVRTGTPATSAVSQPQQPQPPPPSYHFLAAELLDLLTEYRECRQEIHLLSGNAVFLRLIHRVTSPPSNVAPTNSNPSAPHSSPSTPSANAANHATGALNGTSTTSSAASSSNGPLLPSKEIDQICLPVLRCLANQALEPESSREIRVLGGIQMLLGLISQSEQQHAAASSSTSSSSSLALLRTPPLSDAIIISSCICLTQLALDDENAFHLRKAGAVYLLGILFLRGPNSPHPQSSYSRDVQSHACRALRFLYSVERNRKVFKRLFPLPDLFAAFIDIGHYVHGIEAYEHIVDLLNSQSSSNLQIMRQAFDTLKSTSTTGVDGKLPVIRGYVIQEVLGKGAFGTVYQVQRENGDKLYAMKELSLKELQKASGITISSGSNSSASSADAVHLAAKEMGKEVEILSQLDHPNIVRYYTSFLEGPSVYIVMELVEGASLLDHINSWVEKGTMMPEEAIWPIFIQLCLALCYMHMEKRVVHRDLTPSNIMINDKKVVKIADCKETNITPINHGVESKRVCPTRHPLTLMSISFGCSTFFSLLFLLLFSFSRSRSSDSQRYRLTVGGWNNFIFVSRNSHA